MLKRTEYPVYYCLRETGTLTQGPNIGMVLDNNITEAMGEDIPYGEQCTLAAARHLAAKHRALEPNMHIEICSKTFRSKPKKHFHYEVVEIYP